MKHTPGPWFYRQGDEWSHSVVTHHGELPDGSPSYWTVASINKQREPEHVANAVLIAAAPDLLDAAQRLAARGWFAPSTCSDTETSRDMESMLSAIAKATGGEA